MESIKEDINTINVVFEQLFFYQLSKKNNKSIKTLYNQSFFDNMANLIKFEQTPFKHQYVHCLGEFKKDNSLCKQIEFRLCFEYNDYYRRIIEYLEIDSVENTSEYIRFKKINKLFSQCTESDDLLAIPLTLASEIEILQIKDDFRLKNGDNIIKLEAWNKYLLFFENNFITGNELIEYILKSNIGHNFSEDDIKENIIGVITQNTIIHQNLDL